MKSKLLFALFFVIAFHHRASAQWQVISNLDSSFYGIYFTDDTTGYICGSHGIIRKTKNAGNSWMNLNSGTTDRLNDILFVNDSVGFVCSNYGRVYKTMDRGASWNQCLFSGSVIPELSFPTDSIGFIINDVPFDLTEFCYKTTDQGTTWQISGNLNFPFGYSELSIIYSLDFPTTTNGYATADGKVFFKTSDGGVTWSSGYVNNLTADVYDLDFVNVDTGFLSNSDGFGSYPYLYETTDGGTTWNSLIDQEFNKINFLNKDTGYAAYYNIDKTIDGGATWNLEFSSLYPILDFSFPSDTIGYAITDNFFAPGQLLRLGNPAVVLGCSEQQSNLKVFNQPNPFHDYLLTTITVPAEANAEIELTELQGRVMISETNSLHEGANHVLFNTNNLPLGLYFIMIRTPGLLECFKVSKCQ